LHYHYGEAQNGSLNLSQGQGSAIRQPTLLPRLQIPPRGVDSSSSPSAQRVDISVSAFHSATATISGHKFQAPAFRGPLSAPDASEDFRYHQLYEDPNRVSNMVPSNAVASGSGSGSGSRSRTADATDRRSNSPQSPVRATRRQTTTAVIACRQWCVTWPS
jgi:hypothetical protein